MNNNKKEQRKIGFAGKLASIFLKNKQLGFLSVAVLLLWGVLSFFLMPKQYNPEIIAPAFSIETSFSGASSDEVYELVTRPMENKLRELPKVDKIVSQSFDGGVSMVMVQFFIGENLEDAKISLMQKLESNMEIKPTTADKPIIREINPDDVPILTIAFSSNEYSRESLRKISLEVSERLKQLGGVSKIETKGGGKRQLEVTLDEGRLTTFGVSVQQIVQTIQNNNLRVVAGNIEGESLNQKVILDGNIRTKEDLMNLVVSKDKEKTILLSDLGDVEYVASDAKEIVRFTTKDSSEEAVYLGIAKLKGANATNVSKEVLAEFEKIKGEIVPAGVKVSVVRDDGRVAAEEIRKLTQNLFTAIAIVSFVLFLFLGWKSALVVAIAIPLTLAAVFGIGNLFGQTVNRITLFALILSLGLLVDGATVVVENVYRLLKEKLGEDKEAVVIEAVDEVGSGLVMSTVTTILAFIPMAFISGMMGPYMGPIPFFVPAALLVSLLVALMINPFLLSSIIRKKDLQEKKKENFFLKSMVRLRGAYNRLLVRMLDSQKLRRRILLVVAILFLVSMSFPLFKIVKFRMLPKADREQFFVYFDLPATATLKTTDEAVKVAERALLQNEEVRSIQSFVGQSQVVDFNGLFKGSDGRTSENQATLKINLSHPNERQETSAEIAFETRVLLLKELEKFPDLKLKIIEDPPGPPVVSTFLLKIQGENQISLEKIARDIEAQAEKIAGVVDVDTNIVEQSIEHAFQIDTEKASTFGLSASEIAFETRAVLGDLNVGLFHQSSQDQLPKREQEFIVIKFAKEDRDDFVDIKKIFISNSNGDKVPLSELVLDENSKMNPVIFSDNQKKTVYVSAEMGNRSVTYGMIDMFMFLRNYKLASGEGSLEKTSLMSFDFVDKKTGERIEILLDGEWKLTLEVFRDLGIAMAVAIFLIYFVLVAQFSSLRIPLLIMGTIPLAMIGVMPGFALLGAINGMYFNATSMIGVIALAGIVVNNAIILLEYLNFLKREKMEIKEAILQAGKVRLLPILLTSMTTVLSSLTIISDPVWAGLSWAIIWGLSLSMFLTLIIFPVLYFEFERGNWGKSD
jgi:multidrug efflux pump subunit AcrB